MLKNRTFLSGISDKNVLISIALVVNAFVWYYVVLVRLQDSLQDSPLGLWVWLIHFSAIIGSALLGASLTRRIERSQLVVSWMLLGVLSSLFLFRTTESSFFVIGVTALLLGSSLGLGMPACMSYFTDCVDVEKRGRFSGLTLLLSGIGIFGLGFAAQEMQNDLAVGIMLAIWRLLSLLLFLSAKSFQKIERKKYFASYKSIINQESFVLYFAPWVMFSMINYLGIPLESTAGISDQLNLQLIQTGFMGLFAVVGGFFLDLIGRKRVAIAGFALLGIGSAVMGLSTGTFNVTILYFNAIVDGIAWGLLLVLFVLVLWSDLSYGSTSDKYYALGVLPFFASRFLEITIGRDIINIFTENRAALFSLTAFFLFLAVLPLVYAPETLPEKIIKERELNNYIAKAEKEARKNKTNDTDDAQRKNIDVELDFETMDFEEVQEELEKTKQPSSNGKA
jgi:MFS family permease